MHDRREHDIVLSELTTKVNSLTKELRDHIADETESLKKYHNKVEDIHEILVGARITLKVIKVTAIVVSSLAASWVFLKTHFTVGLK